MDFSLIARRMTSLLIAALAIVDSASGWQILQAAEPSRKLLQRTPDSGENPDEHPLKPLVIWAEEAEQKLEQDVKDYTCIMVKRERVNGQLLPREYMLAKVRHEQVEDGKIVIPFGIYLSFEHPKHLVGREVLFVKGENDDNILVRQGGRFLPSLTVSLDPTSMLAMNGNRHPVTEFGIQRFLQRMAKFGRDEMAFDECEVKICDKIDMEEHDYKRIEIIHPIAREHFQYHLTRVYIDNQTELPIRFESYMWPEKEGEDPVLTEEYTYKDLKVNVGLTDADFDRDNPEYRFMNK